MFRHLRWAACMDLFTLDQNILERIRGWLAYRKYVMNEWVPGFLQKKQASIELFYLPHQKPSRWVLFASAFHRGRLGGFELLRTVPETTFPERRRERAQAQGAGFQELLTPFLATSGPAGGCLTSIQRFCLIPSSKETCKYFSFGFHADVTPFANLNLFSFLPTFQRRLVVLLLDVGCTFPFSASGQTEQWRETDSFLL